jgi:hypothetical protein
MGNISRLPAVKSNQNNSINLQSHKKKRSCSTVKTMPPKEPFKIKLNSQLFSNKLLS